MPFDCPLKDTQAVLPRQSETLRQKRHRLRRQAAKLLPNERVSACGVKRHSKSVDIVRTKHGAHFVGLETCGSVWHCPVCASKVAETRREEVAQAIGEIKSMGGNTYMMTLTARHDRADDLGPLKEQMVNSWRKVQNRRAYRALKDRFLTLGTIRAFEVTHGQGSGWHPHFHVLFCFLEPLTGADAAAFEAALAALWIDVLGKSGRYVSLEGLDFRPANASDYVTKWGADRELVKGQEKLAKGAGRTPWQLLEDADRGDTRAAVLFREYAETFKGTRQLTWSRGLKVWLSIDDVDDKDAATDRTETDDQLPLDDGLWEGRIATLPGPAVDLMARKKLTAELLDAAHAQGWPGVRELLAAHHVVLDDDLDVEGVYTAVRFKDSFAWKQPPKGGLPPTPGRYVRFTKAEFMAHVAAIAEK